MVTVRLRPAPHAVPRALLATGEIMLAVTVAHTVAGGRLPALAWLLGLAGVVFVASLPAVTGRGRLLPMLAGVGLAQFGLHAAITLLAPAHVHAASSTYQTSMSSSHGAGLDAAMVTAHLVGVAATALVWRWRRRLVEAVIAWAEVAPTRPPGRSAVTGGVQPVPGQARWLVYSSPRRGPPAQLGCA